MISTLKQPWQLCGCYITIKHTKMVQNIFVLEIRNICGLFFSYYSENLLFFTFKLEFLQNFVVLQYMEAAD
jgi:hypothetical protein